ncbi:hypothetical protein D3C76_1436780 [compost metagenome]
MTYSPLIPKYLRLLPEFLQGASVHVYALCRKYSIIKKKITVAEAAIMNNISKKTTLSSVSRTYVVFTIFQLLYHIKHVQGQGVVWFRSLLLAAYRSQPSRLCIVLRFHTGERHRSYSTIAEGFWLHNPFRRFS